MSLDASVYAAELKSISRDVLQEKAAQLGWVMHAVHDIFAPEQFGVITGGELSDGDYWYGWRRNDPHAPSYFKALESRDVKQLESWAQQDFEKELGAAFTYFGEYTDDMTPETEQELIESEGTDYVEAMRSAKFEYLIELHANNDDFRILLAQLVHGLTGGIWIDHLGGKYGIAPDQVRMRTAPISDPGPIEWIIPGIRKKRWWELWK